MFMDGSGPAAISMSKRKCKVRRIFDERTHNVSSWRDNAALECLIGVSMKVSTAEKSTIESKTRVM